MSLRKHLKITILSSMVFLVCFAAYKQYKSPWTFFVQKTDAFAKHQMFLLGRHEGEQPIHLFIYSHNLYERLVSHTHTHQALVSEGVVNTANEKPERPEVLEAELQHKVCQQHQRPDHQKLQVQERTETHRTQTFSHTSISTLHVALSQWTSRSNSIMSSSSKSNPMNHG